MNSLLYIGGLGGAEFWGFGMPLLVLGLMFIPLLLALIDILSSDFRDSIAKLIWVLVVILVPCMGSILYFAIGRNQKIRKNDNL